MVETINLRWDWQFQWGSALIIGLVVFVYWRGRRTGRRQPVPADQKIRPAFFMAGLGLLMMVLLSPLNDMATQLFSARVIQRILLVGLIPFFFCLSNPAYYLLWGLPQSIQTHLGSLPDARPRAYRLIVNMTRPSFVWVFFVCTVWLFYDQQLHQLTLTYDWLHSLETSWLLLAALLYWWHILAVAPVLHDPLHPIVRIVYAIIGSGPVKFVGFILLFSTQTIYNYPASLQFTGLKISDQNLGGMLIWVLGGIVFTWMAAYLMRQWLSLEDDKPYMPLAYWASEEALMAPGFGKKRSPQPRRPWRVKEDSTD